MGHAMDLLSRGWKRSIEQRLLNAEELAGRVGRLECRLGALEAVLEDTVDAIAELGVQLDGALAALSARLAGHTAFRPTDPLTEESHGEAI